MPFTEEEIRPFLTTCFIETGTGSGSGILCALNSGFPEVRSIEVLSSVVNQAKDKFKFHPVTIYEGLSEKLLNEVLSDIEEPVTIFFDAHYSGPGSYMGDNHSPLMEELEAIKNHHIKNHILIIDDIGLFGRPELPNLDIEKVKKKVLEINSEYKFLFIGNFMACQAPVSPKIIYKVLKLEQIQTDNIYPYIEKLLTSIEKPIFFEVGAANGEDTERISNINKNVIYYAFEPDVRNIESLKARKLNINMIESAVGSYNGKTIFYMSSGTNPTYGYEHTLSSSTKRPRKHLEVFPWCKFDRIVNADICTLDNFCKNEKIKYIDFLWSDIQGAEADLIKGGRRILTNTAYLYLEYSSTPMYDNQYTYEQLIDLIGNQFEVVHKFSGDVLLRNKNLS